MAESKELKSICELLGIEANFQEQNNTNLLNLIVNKLSTCSGSSDQNTKKTAKLIDSERICDSLAFPEKTRCNRNLMTKPELWDNLKQFNDILKLDYSSRRQMLLNRLDCTVESFKWKAANKAAEPASDKNSPLNDLIHEKYEKARMHLRDEPNITLSHLLAVRETESDTLLNSVASSCGTDGKVVYKEGSKGQGELISLKQVVIPAVPDRGGRTGEIRAPAKESFSQQRRGRGRGGRR